MKKTYLAAASLLLAHSAYADGILDPTPGWLKVVTVSGGPAWTSPGENQMYVAPMQPFPYTYIRYNAHKDTDTIATGEAFMGLQRNFSALALRLGIAIAGSTPATLTGSFSVDGQPVTDYSYKVSHVYVAGKAMLIACPNYWINPYLSSSIGVGFNSSKDFSTTNQLYVGVANGANVVLVPFDFDSNTTGSLSYTVGTGVNVKLNSNWEVGVGYEFADWGKSQLSTTPVVSNVFAMPKLNNLYTHELQFSLSFLY